MRDSVCIPLFTFIVFLNCVESTGRIFVDRQMSLFTEDEQTGELKDDKGQPAFVGLYIKDLQGNRYKIDAHRKAAPYESDGLILWDRHGTPFTEDRRGIVWDGGHQRASQWTYLYDWYNQRYQIRDRRAIPVDNFSQPISAEQVELNRQIFLASAPQTVHGYEIQHCHQAHPGFFSETVHGDEIQLHHHTRPGSSSASIYVYESEPRRQTRPGSSSEPINVDEIAPRRQTRPGSFPEPTNFNEIARSRQMRPRSSSQRVRGRGQARAGSFSETVHAPHQTPPRTSREPIDHDQIERDAKPLGKFYDGMIYPPNDAEPFTYEKKPGDAVKIGDAYYSVYLGKEWFECNS